MKTFDEIKNYQGFKTLSSQTSPKKVQMMQEFHKNLILADDLCIMFIEICLAVHYTNFLINGTVDFKNRYVDPNSTIYYV